MSNILITGHYTPDPVSMTLRLMNIMAGRHKAQPHPRLSTPKVSFFGPGSGTAKNYNERVSANGWNHYSDRANENGWNARTENGG